MRLVIKIGTNILADESGMVHAAQIERVAEPIAQAKKAGHEVILVTSGAIGMGRALLPHVEFPAKQQIWAAIGQAELIKVYISFFRKQGITAGQCLLVRNDFSDRERYENAVRTIEGLLAEDCLPVVNENDVVVMEDLTFGDNDVLAAMIAIALKADKLILLTNQKGLYTSNPETDPAAEFIPQVENVDRKFEEMCVTGTSSLGRGGMVSKVRAAKHAVHAGIETVIADGRDSSVVEHILAGQRAGTRFVPLTPGKVDGQKRWLLSAKGFGQILIDPGAAAALRSGKSLLFPGIISLKGMFDRQEIVEIIGHGGETIGYGRINYDSRELAQALSRRQDRSHGESLEREVIHRNYMLVL